MSERAAKGQSKSVTLLRLRSCSALWQASGWAAMLCQVPRAKNCTAQLGGHFGGGVGPIELVSFCAN